MAGKNKQTKKTNNKFNLTKKLLVVVAVILVATAVVAQILFNMYVKQTLDDLSTLEIKSLVKEASENLENIKSTPDKGADNRQYIPEARLVLPPYDEFVDKVIYGHYEATNYTDENGTNYPTAEYLELTTKSISMTSRSAINGHDLNHIFDKVAESQACSRGFTLRFEPTDTEGQKLSGQVALADGRQVYIYRETECNSPSMNDLESYLLKVESY